MGFSAAFSSSSSPPACAMSFDKKLFRNHQKIETQTTSLSSGRSNHNIMMIEGCQENHRRSANYHPTIWDNKFIESLTTPYTYELQGSKLEKLKQEVRKLLKSDDQDTSSGLKLVDSIQRLGVAYHFEEEINDKLMKSFHHERMGGDDLDLYTTSLRFRLLRQHGFPVSSEDTFEEFKDKKGSFEERLSEDVVGLLGLYEASHLGIPGEDDLEEAKNFSAKHLQQHLQHQQSHDVLVELAQLDYNLVQSIHQQELKELTRWWRDLDFKEKLSFSRDRLMENYLWAMGTIVDPRLSFCRKSITKFVCILTAIDDIYDIYGSLDELQRFTLAVRRWSIEAMDELPDYMKLCYLDMFNFGNEAAYVVLKDHGLNILPSIIDEWAKLCEAYMVEAKWFYSGYRPSLAEYLENAWISVGGHAAVAHACLLRGLPASLDSEPAIYWSSLITRLSDDLGTAKAEILRGDVTKSIQCYMNSNEGVSEEEARDHIKSMISFAWKRLNEECLKKKNNNDDDGKSAITITIVQDITLNMARTAQSIFQYGDGIGTSTGATRDRLNSLIITPITQS